MTLKPVRKDIDDLVWVNKCAVRIAADIAVELAVIGGTASELVESLLLLHL